ncbi:MAG: D-alanine--D-alanine ligase [Wenzhouxiangellaceae bacterium]
MSRSDHEHYGCVALACGGDSAEREVSLRSGAAVQAALERLGVDHVVLDGGRAVIEAALGGGISRVFNLLHGRGGEDGRLQGALALLQIPVTGSGVLASALAMDKLQTKRVWRSLGLPTPEWETVTANTPLAALKARLRFPVFVKPAHEGSSVGMSRVETPDALDAAIDAALRHDPVVLVERLIEGPEYTAAILDRTALPLIRVETPRTFYDYEAKYLATDTRYHCPCGLPSDAEAALARLALSAFDALGLSGWGRVDLMLDADAQPWLLEANTVPGMTDHSLVPMAAAAAGIDFDSLVLRILDTARVPT